MMNWGTGSEKESWSLYVSERHKETAMLTPQYPLIKGTNYLIIFFSSSFNSIFCHRGRTSFFQAVLCWFRHLTYIILGYLTKTVTDLTRRHKETWLLLLLQSCRGLQQLSYARNWAELLRVTQKTRGCSTQHEKIRYSERGWLFLLRGWSVL